MAVREGVDLFRFPQIEILFPELKIRFEYLDFPWDSRPTVKRLLSPRKLQEFSERMYAIDDIYFAYVFNHDGIQGGLVAHSIKVPEQKDNAIITITSEFAIIRIQRFSDFCKLLRANNGSPIFVQPAQKGPERAANLVEFARSNLTPTALRLRLLLAGWDADPRYLLLDDEYDTVPTARIVDGETYMVISHEVLADWLNCTTASIKRALKELSGKNLLSWKKFGSKNGYRITQHSEMDGDQ